ncbi:MAG TPA: TMEM165/GDT1 family protein, partial [Acidimicrobiia bacterium]
MDLGIAAAVFPLIFLAELPDKTMFASLVLASRGRPRAVWVGAAAAFLVHVVIATTVGAALFAVLPPRAVDAVVAALFLAGAVYAFVETRRDESALIDREVATRRRIVVTAFVVIFLAEWGDLTQILTANLAAHYHSAVSVGVGALLALWLVAALAVASGQTLLRIFPAVVVRRVTA